MKMHYTRNELANMLNDIPTNVFNACANKGYQAPIHMMRSVLSSGDIFLGFTVYGTDLCAKVGSSTYDWDLMSFEAIFMTEYKCEIL